MRLLSGLGRRIVWPRGGVRRLAVAAGYAPSKPFGRVAAVRVAAAAAASALAAASFVSTAELAACDDSDASDRRRWRRKDEDAKNCASRTFTDDYTIGAELGSGAFGAVYRGVCKRTGKAVAIKEVPKSRQSAESLHSELEVLQRVSLHKSIASLEAFYETEDRFYLVMELVSGGDLLDKIITAGPYGERDAATLVQELGGALALLHAQGLCHADLKPENLMLTEEGHVKLVDFGEALSYGGHLATAGHKVGTPAYWPPEMFVSDESSPTPAGDMWALGVILYVALTGRHPFDDPRSLGNTMFNVTHLRIDFSSWPASAACRDLVVALLRTEPNERLTIEQLLQHPWLVQSAPAVGAPADPASRAREAELHRFRLESARLRAAVFAVMLRQTAERASELRVHDSAPGTAPVPLRRIGSVRAALLERDLLSRAFREFDTRGRGYITEADLRRVLDSFGTSGPGKRIDDAELHTMLEAAAGYDREARRITYGNFIRAMSHTVKQTVDRGAKLFQQGDPAQYFYILLSGQVELVHTDSDGDEEVVSTVEAGDFFGENALLRRIQSRRIQSAAPTRHFTARCTQPSEVLKLAKEDFDIGFLGRSSSDGGDRGHGRETAMDLLGPMDPAIVEEGARRQARETLLRFILMVTTGREKRGLARGDVLFRAGDAVDRLFIVTEGKLEVAEPAFPQKPPSPEVDAASGGKGGSGSEVSSGGDEGSGGVGARSGGDAGNGGGRIRTLLRRLTSRTPDFVTSGTDAASAKAQVLAEVREGECCGEMALLQGRDRHSKTVTCAAETCHLIAVPGHEFVRLAHKSSALRDSFVDLSRRRSRENTYAGEVRRAHSGPTSPGNASVPGKGILADGRTSSSSSSGSGGGMGGGGGGGTGAGNGGSRIHVSIDEHEETFSRK